MGFDSLTMAALADEFKTILADGRVQMVVQTERRGIGLEIYARKRYYLIASTEPQHPFVYLGQTKPRRGVDQPTSFLLLLRKYLQNARLNSKSIEHVQFERVLCLRFQGPQGLVSLVIEAIGRRSNLILVDNKGLILEAIRRVPHTQSPNRPILPGKDYKLPRPQVKLSPSDVDQVNIQRILAAGGSEPAWRAVVKGIMGTSPLFAREVVYRATGDALTPANACESAKGLLDAFEQTLISLWEHQWSPCIVRSSAKGGPVIEYAPYWLEHLEFVEPVDSISAAIEAYVGDAWGWEPYAQARTPLAQAIESAQNRLHRRIKAIARSAPDPAETNQLCEWGQWILTYAHSIQPGQTELLVDQESPVTIPLDPTLSPPENAQVYFKRYKKAQRAAAIVPKRIVVTKHELAYLEQLAADLMLAPDRPSVDEVRQALVKAGYMPSRSKRMHSPPTRPLRIVSPDGFVIWVGRNVRQNLEVSFQRAQPDDLWLHVRGLPGGHVVIKSGGRETPESTLLLAAGLAACYSVARDEDTVDVDFTRRALVRRLGGGKPGLVTYKGEQTLRVAPISEDDLDLRV